jgi:hypothetical protein
MMIAIRIEFRFPYSQSSSGAFVAGSAEMENPTRSLWGQNRERYAVSAPLWRLRDRYLLVTCSGSKQRDPATKTIVRHPFWAAALVFFFA